MSSVQDIAGKAKELEDAGKKPREIIEALVDLGHAAGFVSIGETMTSKRVVLDFHNGELIEFDGAEWRYKRIESSPSHGERQ